MEMEEHSKSKSEANVENRDGCCPMGSGRSKLACFVGIEHMWHHRRAVPSESASPKRWKRSWSTPRLRVKMRAKIGGSWLWEGDVKGGKRRGFV
jgi:hypothetical protein